MVGLTRSASYRAARSGQIPTIPAGKGRIVPRLIWERLLGIESPLMSNDRKETRAAASLSTT
jgi:hypothetical protein